MIGAGSLIYAAPAPAQALPEEPIDISIRRMAGLPVESADGQIKIVDVGHHPLDPMISIAANRTGEGWSVSYACAASRRCASSGDHKAAVYILSAEATAEVDAILQEFESGKEPDGQLPDPHVLGGRLLVSINHNGLKRDYSRAGSWGQQLGRLHHLLASPAG